MASVKPTRAISSRKIDRRISQEHLVDVRSLWDLWQQHQTISLINGAVVIPPQTISHGQSGDNSPTIPGIDRILVLPVVPVQWRRLESGGLARGIQSLRDGTQNTRNARQQGCCVIVIGSASLEI